jgi:acetylornithine/LysW-gamma-L-lysine aminotransferase
LNGEDKYVGNLYQRFPINVARGKDAKVWDISGKEYIDCMAGYGVALVGHCNDRVVAAIKNQVEDLIVCHMSVYNNTRLEFLQRLVGIAPVGLNKVFLSNSGAEAIEAALKFSRKYTQKTGVIAMRISR